MLFLLRPRQSVIQYAPPRPPAPPATPAAPTNAVTQLKELAALHESGVLTDDEFAAAKRAVIESEP